MADGVEPQPPLAHATDEHAAEARLPAPVALTGRGRRESLPHAPKFRAAMALLFGIAVAAIVIALTSLAGGGHQASQKWSEWSPPDTGIQGAREIADHIAPLYRISGTDQLAVVTVSNLNSSSTAASANSGSGSQSSGGLQVAVRSDPNSSAVSLIGGHTIAYDLCGLGSTNCSIGVGTPSPDRLLLLRREALELALYTFRYISGTQNVVAILPPGHLVQTNAGALSPKPPSRQAKATTTQKPLNVALLFLHDELKPLLDQPLSTIFPEQFPPSVPEVAAWKQTPEAGLVEQVTSRGMFSEHVTTAQDGTNLLVLDPMPPS
jgi:hypothetical protein